MNYPALLVHRATLDDLEPAADLFDAYRQFYGQPPARESAREFLGQRLQREQSAILLAWREAACVGFCQLYPSYSSVAMRPFWVLNDLYVAAAARRRGVAKRLLLAAVELAASQGACRLELATAHTNAAAQALYEGLGWVPEMHYLRYAYALD